MVQDYRNIRIVTILQTLSQHETPKNSIETTWFKWNLEIKSIFLRFQTGVQKPNKIFMVFEVELRNGLGNDK